MKDITVSEIKMHKDNLQGAIEALVSEYVAATGLQPTVCTECEIHSSMLGGRVKVSTIIVKQEL